MSTGKVIIAVAVAAVCIGGPLYLHNKVKSKVAGFAQSVDKIATILPKNLKQEHTYESGFFSTTGKYVLSAKDEESFSEVGVVEYKMDHGLSHLFSSKYPLSMTLNFNWNELPHFDITDASKPYYVLTGSYQTNGSFDLAGEAQDLKVKIEETETEMVVSGNHLDISYDKSKGEAVVKNIIKKISDEQAGEEFNDIVSAYKYTLPEGAKSGYFDVDVSVGSAKQGYADFYGLNMHVNGGEQGDYVNAGFSLKADKITSALAGNKVFSFDMAMSLKDLEAPLYRKLAELGDLDKEISLEQSEELVKLLQDTIDGGFKWNIDRLNVTDTEDQLKSELKFSLAKKEGNQTFKDRSSLSSNVYLKSPFVSSAINVIPPELRDLMVGKVNEINVDFLYKSGKVVLNGNQLPEEYSEFLNEYLLGLEESLQDIIDGLKQDLNTKKGKNSV